MRYRCKQISIISAYFLSTKRGLTMTDACGTDGDCLRCGYIKAKFTIPTDKELSDCAAYLWANEHKRPRVTQHFIYVNFGHDDIGDNDNARDIIRMIAQHGGKITRLDFCVDYLGKLDFGAFYDLHDNQRKPDPSIVKSPTGATVYVGKRSSARLLRAYDKRGEIIARKKVDIGFDITRLELEVKRNMVERYRQLFMLRQETQIVQDIQELYGLRGFCSRHDVSRPTEIRDKQDSLWGFIQRYHAILGRAYKQDKCQFLDIIGASKDD
jgi:hypothetical protein